MNRWTTDLSFELLNTITDDPTLKKVLFPGVDQNASYSEGGGMTKKEAHWLTAVALLGEKEQFSADIATAKEKGAAGLTDPWTGIREEKPWYFEMKALLAERPNITPVGIGNSTTTLDVEGDIVPGPRTDEEGEGGEASTGTSHAGSGSDKSDDDDDEDIGGREQTAGSRIDKPAPKKATPAPVATAQPGKSQPAEKPEKKTAKKTKFQEFAELELAEEKSRGKELENQQLNTLKRHEQVTWEGKVEVAREERKAAERKMKHEMKMKRMEQQHEFRMQLLRSQSGMTSAWTMSPMLPMSPMPSTDSVRGSSGNGQATVSYSGYSTPGSSTLAIVGTSHLIPSVHLHHTPRRNGMVTIQVNHSIHVL
ncbi:hypothetical protein V5O48_012756 [Marasmius crinis-equi]|uniref:No apical meristem-associated C-terminal domain-containing protein n=1 Tax=Marasmius crinis-equi TaxID=585013 RepID=A0ABR3F1Y8_9AGAR